MARPRQRVVTLVWSTVIVRIVIGGVLVIGCVVASVAGRTADERQSGNPRLFPRPLLHAHNAYPEGGRWDDRIDRALSAGLRPVAIEQDLVWAVDREGRGRIVVAHGVPLTGAEPTLEAHFFARVAPLMTAALAASQRDTWPVLVLHLDFKTNEPAHHAAVWDLLGRHQAWLTTAVRTVSDVPQPFQVGPLLVLTENGEGQANTFYDRVPVGERLRLFGTVPAPVLSQSADRQVQLEAAFAAPADRLMPSGATNYRRWVNFPWAVVERGGQALAGPWDEVDAERLEMLTARARALGLWTRFYTLNGHAPGEGRGWTQDYNFGSEEAVVPRWRAALRAGVDLVATDQYEAFAAAAGSVPGLVPLPAPGR